MKNNSHFLSVIIPTYKQEKTIYQDLININETLKQIRYDYEIIVVVDGANIDNSYQEAKRTKLKKLKVFSYKYNHGKGYAVRFGMSKTKGDYVSFIDSGM